MDNIDELIDRLARDAEPVKPAPHPLRLGAAWLAIMLLYLAVLLGFSGMRPDWMQQLHAPWFLAEIAILFLILLSTSASAALLSFPDLYQMRPLALTPIGLFGVFAVLLFMSWRAHMPPPPLPDHDLECTVCITLVSIPPAIGILYTMRRIASTHYRYAASVALLCAFSVGALWLRLHEINDSIVHVVEWHYLPMLAAGAIGLALGKALLKW